MKPPAEEATAAPRPPYFHAPDRPEDELRYPIGRFRPEDGIAEEARRARIQEVAARIVGLSVKPTTKLLIAPIAGVGREYPLSSEKLFPVLSVYWAASTGEALEVCVKVNRYGGVGHTAVIFSNRDEIIDRFLIEP